jgi:hypothetical protein
LAGASDVEPKSSRLDGPVGATIVADGEISLTGSQSHVQCGVYADTIHSDFSESAPFSQVTGLYVIEDGARVEYTRNAVDFIVTDARYLDYDREGQFNLFELPPGDYQPWSLKAPNITVVSCAAD